MPARRIDILANLAGIPDPENRKAFSGFVHIPSLMGSQLEKELDVYWKKQGEFTSPEAICAQLLKNRVADGSVTPKHAAILGKALDDSFSREIVTGYYAKHRLPLIHALQGMYLLTQREKTVFHVEGDVGNLGGLNKALKDTSLELFNSDRAAFNLLARKYGIGGEPEKQPDKLGRFLADKVLGVICHVVAEKLGAETNLVPIRKGGDELEFIVQPLRGQTHEDLKTIEKEAQREVAQFIEDAGLKLIPHLKIEKRTHGVSIGLHSVVAEDTLENQQQLLDDGITENKKLEASAQRQRSPVFESVVHPDLFQLDSALERAGAKLSARPSLPSGELSIRVNPHDAEEAPDSARRNTLQHALLKAGGQLGIREIGIADAVHDLSRQLDSVTDMPLFSNMEREMLPVFVAHKGGAAHGGEKLMLVDMSNMAGGNTLASALGDAMGKAYAQCLSRAMKTSHMSEYMPYAAAMPGGKFALLVPGDIEEEKLKKFADILCKEIDAMAELPLPMQPITRRIVRNQLEKSKELRNLYGENGEKLFDKGNRILAKNIVNPKSHQKGIVVSVAVSPTPISLHESLEDHMIALQAETDRAYAATVANNALQPPAQYSGRKL